MGCTLSFEGDAELILNDNERAKEISFTSIRGAKCFDIAEEGKDGEEMDEPVNLAEIEPVLVVDERDESANSHRKRKVNKPTSPKSVEKRGPLSSLDNLRNVVRNMKCDVDSRIKNHMQPTKAQLEDFIKRICSVLKNLAGNAPTSIKKVMASSFLLCGYEFVSGLIVSPTKFTLHYLAESLKFMRSQLNAWTPSPLPTVEEAKSIKIAATRLWELDGNRLEQGVDYELNIQCEKSAHNHKDMAKDNLFSYVDQDVFQRPTYKTFSALLDNYVSSLGVSEVYSKREREEIDAFMTAIKDTQCMQYCHAWLAKNKKAPRDYDTFIKKVQFAWFTLYRRKVENDSSGFEHVFLGERDEQKKTVSGLHNWIQLANEERAGFLDYKGRIKSKHESSDLRFITIQFEWHQQEKFVSSTLIGTSPEFEIALLSMCFFSGQENTIVKLGSREIAIKCFSIRRRGKKYLGSAFPEEIE